MSSKDNNISSNDIEISYDDIVRVLNNLLMSPTAEDLPDIYVKYNDLKYFYNYISRVRSILWSFAQGDFNHDVDIKGAIGGALKSLQANLRHLSWQVQMVADGDFTQRVDFMGEFSSAFNTMVVKFEQTLKDLTEQRELLKGITEDLHKEISIRTQAEEALKKSEELYRSLARLDSLTGMYNRRYFFEIASAEIDRMVRNNSGICCIAMIDIDHFKTFNDTYGHLVGDLCLKHVGKLLQDKVRRFDIVARYGGEEFIILLPQTSIDAGYTVMERVRSEIEKATIATDQGNVSVTVSIGITEFEATKSHNADVMTILKKYVSEADEALYRAKHNSRNQVSVYKD